MTHEMQWKCLSAGNAWTFIKLSAIMLVIGVGIDGYLLLAHGADTLGGIFDSSFWRSGAALSGSRVSRWRQCGC